MLFNLRLKFQGEEWHRGFNRLYKYWKDAGLQGTPQEAFNHFFSRYFRKNNYVQPLMNKVLLPETTCYSNCSIKDWKTQKLWNLDSLLVDSLMLVRQLK